MRPEQLYIELFMVGKSPSCACGCGQTITKFWDIEKGYSKFVRGHHSRVKNNWGHNKEAQQKSQDTRRVMHDRGEIKIWNRGETKNSDDRVAAYGIKGSNTIMSQISERKRRADGIKKSWETGAIVPLAGADHSQWKGGVSALQPFVRSHLFRAWSRPIMERDGFACRVCGKQSDLCVHHDGERFSTVLQKAMERFRVDDASQLTFEQKSELCLWVIDYHLDNGVSGVTLCEDCHTAAHASDNRAASAISHHKMAQE